MYLWFLHWVASWLVLFVVVIVFKSSAFPLKKLDNFFYYWSTVDKPYCISQVYNIILQHSYTLQSDHHIKSSNHLSLYKVIMILTVFPTLYITSLWPIEFITRRLYFLFPFTFFTHPATSLSSDSIIINVTLGNLETKLVQASMLLTLK